MNNRIRRTIVVALAIFMAIVPLSGAASAVTGGAIPVYFHVIRNDSSTAGQPLTFTAAVQLVSATASDPGNVEVLVKILNAPAGEPLMMTATNLETGETASHRINPWNLTLKRGVMSVNAIEGQTIRIRIATTDNSVAAAQDVPVAATAAGEAFSFYIATGY